MLNTLTLHDNTQVVVAKQQLPYSNNFVVQRAITHKRRGKRVDIYCTVLCSACSKEPGRQYSCVYIVQNNVAMLQQCETLN
jgi:hypothetical protein